MQDNQIFFQQISTTMDVLYNQFENRIKKTNPLTQVYVTAQKMKFSIKDFFGKCDEIRSFLRIWSHLLKKSLMENFIFCAVWQQDLYLLHK